MNTEDLIIKPKHEVQSSKESRVTNCARIECDNLVELFIEDETIYICGLPSAVCLECDKLGYSVSSGIGDGQTRIFKDGVLIDQFRSF